MSTTTNFKRIALVAVAALGLGVLSSVPSNAAISTGSLTLSASTSTQETTDTLTSTAATVTLTYLADGTTDSIAVTAGLLTAPSGNTVKPVLALKETSTAFVDTDTTRSAASDSAQKALIGETTTANVPSTVRPSAAGLVTAVWYVYLDGPAKVGAYEVTLTPSVPSGSSAVSLAGAVARTLTINVTAKAALDTTASATNSSKLNDLDPSITVPGGGVASIPVRDTSGNITAVQFVGISDKSDRIRINNSATDPTITGNISAASTADQYRTAMTTQTAWTIAARDGNADLTARVFNGTATSARYADLAEKYLADAEYEVGTVVMVGGEAEVTASVQGSRAIGVVSENPAFMMNSELEGGTYIALKGRVPVKVFGPVTKGDRLIADNNGCAMALKAVNSDTFAIALETNLDNGEKTIEALVL
jgi:hypothetical protein